MPWRKRKVVALTRTRMIIFVVATVVLLVLVAAAVVYKVSHIGVPPSPG